MSKTVFVIRHCKATGQEPDAPLTAQGEEQARELAEQLAPLGIQRIVSSPYRRAVQSVAPLAEQLGLPVHTDGRLVERMLSGVPLDDWLTPLQASFDDRDLCLDGGESSNAASERALAALEDILAHGAQTSALVTHGNLMALLLGHFDKRPGFVFWQGLSNPDVYRLDIADGVGNVTRVVPQKDAKSTK